LDQGKGWEMGAVRECRRKSPALQTDY